MADRPNFRPTHNQLMLPLLQEIEQLGGRAKPGQLYEILAERLAVPDDVVNETKTFADGNTHKLWERRVRWARQTAVLRGLLASPERGIWELTAVGGATLGKIRPGLIFTIFETENGVALWANAEDAAAVIEKDSVQLIFCSTPYPIHRYRVGGIRPLLAGIAQEIAQKRKKLFVGHDFPISRSACRCRASPIAPIPWSPCR